MSIPQSAEGTVENYSQLVQFLEGGCKVHTDWGIGTEHEKFGYDKKSFSPLPYEGETSIFSMLSGLRDTYGWEEVRENKKLIGLKRGGSNISLEPGGQLELSGAIFKNVHQTCNEVSNHLSEIKMIADNIGAGFIGLGASPDWSENQMPMMPKGRYELMTPYMGKVGTHGKKMMYRTCTVQVNLDYSSEKDMIRKMRAGVSLQPIATCLFAASPFFDGKPNGYKSWRSAIWRDTDSSRTGMVPFVYDKGFGFEKWVDYALDVPMYFVYRDGKYLNALGKSFRDFLEGKLDILIGQKPSLSDWADHLTTIFTEVRVKNFIEMRGADGGPWASICALPAFWVGIMYNSGALDEILDLTKDWSDFDREKLNQDVAKKGFEANIRGVPVHKVCKKVLEISRRGLVERAISNSSGGRRDEAHFLDPLFEIVEARQTLADKLLENYWGRWEKDLRRIYLEHSY